jgi:hypothetical protein
MKTITYEELTAARKRLKPYLDGYPQPMIDIRYLRKTKGTASEQELREIEAEQYVLRLMRIMGSEED